MPSIEDFIIRNRSRQNMANRNATKNDEFYEKLGIERNELQIEQEIEIGNQL